MYLQKRALTNLYWHLLWRTLQLHSMIRATILLTGAFNIRYIMTHITAINPRSDESRAAEAAVATDPGKPVRGLT